MATAPSTPVSERTRRLRGLALPTLLAIVVAAVLWVVFDGWYLNYDARYALLWANDAVSGHLPEYKADFAPTPHVLQMAASALALPFGGASDDVVAWMILLCFGALVWVVFRLGEELFGRWPGVVAAAVVLTRPAYVRDTVLAYQDVPFALLVVSAVLLEARRRRRGVAVLVLLALAGLLRPEAWVLAGLYVLWLWREAAPRERAVYVALAALAPVVWALSDFIVTGDALHSLHGTSALAEANERRRSIEQVPVWGPQYLAFTLREPLILGIPVGLAFAWRYRRRAAVLPLVVAAAMLLVFAIGPLFGLPLIGRYVRTPAALLALFYGLAAFGWLRLPPGPTRRNWAIAGMVVLAASVVYLPWHVRQLSGLEARFDRDGQFYADLQRVGESPVVRRAVDRCGPLSTSDHRPIPYVRFWLGAPPGTVGTVAQDASPMGRVLLVPRDVRHVRRFYRENFPRVRPPASMREIERNGSWRVLAEPGCV